MDAQAAARVVEAVGSAFVDEIRGSLDYYLASSGSAPISRLVLTGGGARLGGLAQRLQVTTRVPVEVGTPMHGLQVGRTGLSPEQIALRRAAGSRAGRPRPWSRIMSTLTTTRIGDAAAGQPAASGDRAGAALPPRPARPRRRRRRRRSVSSAVLFLAANSQVSAAEDDLADSQGARRRGCEAQTAEYARFPWSTRRSRPRERSSSWRWARRSAGRST